MTLLELARQQARSQWGHEPVVLWQGNGRKAYLQHSYNHGEVRLYLTGCESDPLVVFRLLRDGWVESPRLDSDYRAWSKRLRRKLEVPRTRKSERFTRGDGRGSKER